MPHIEEKYEFIKWQVQVVFQGSGGKFEEEGERENERCVRDYSRATLKTYKISRI